MSAPRPDADAGSRIDESRRVVEPIQVMISFPILAPLLVDLVAAGLFGSGTTGFLYGFVLFLFWLPFCYLLLGPLFLIIGSLSLWFDRRFRISGLQGRLGATVVACALGGGIWLAVRGVVAAHERAPFHVGVDASTTIASLVLIGIAAAASWTLEPRVLRRAQRIVAGLGRSANRER